MYVVRICDQCGRKFQGTRRARFCSSACRTKHHRDQQETRFPQSDRYCRQCKTRFVSQSSGQAFCSTACRQDYIRNHRHDVVLVEGKPVRKYRPKWGYVEKSTETTAGRR